MLGHAHCTRSPRRAAAAAIGPNGEKVSASTGEGKDAHPMHDQSDTAFARSEHLIGRAGRLLCRPFPHF
jgi:hypothetical protein